jgi:hypothetical protein
MSDSIDEDNALCVSGQELVQLQGPASISATRLVHAVDACGWWRGYPAFHFATGEISSSSRSTLTFVYQVESPLGQPKASDMDKESSTESLASLADIAGHAMP